MIFNTDYMISSKAITFHHILLLLMLSFGLKLPRVIVFVVYAVEHQWYI